MSLEEFIEQTAENQKLKPCPFCGKDAFVANIENTKESRPHGYRFVGRIMCSYCQATAGPSRFDRTEEEATKAAIKCWNLRVN